MPGRPHPLRIGIALRRRTLISGPGSLNNLTRVGSLKELRWLSRERLTSLATLMTTFNVKKGEIIFNESESTKYIYLLLSGTASISCVDTRQKRVLLALVSVGLVPQLPSLSAGIETHVRCEAFTNCRVARIGAGEFIDITLNAKLAHFLAIFDALHGRWASLLVQRSEFLGFEVRQRLALTLVALASEFGVQNARGRLIRISLTHKNLADLVGASRQTVTKCLLGLVRERMIMRSGRQLVVQPERLQALIRPPDTTNRKARTKQSRMP